MKVKMNENEDEKEMGGHRILIGSSNTICICQFLLTVKCSITIKLKTQFCSYSAVFN